MISYSDVCSKGCSKGFTVTTVIFPAVFYCPVPFGHYPRNVMVRTDADSEISQIQVQGPLCNRFIPIVSRLLRFLWLPPILSSFCTDFCLLCVVTVVDELTTGIQIQCLERNFDAAVQDKLVALDRIQVHTTIRGSHGLSIAKRFVERWEMSGSPHVLKGVVVDSRRHMFKRNFGGGRGRTHVVHAVVIRPLTTRPR